jgi:hypothetical protein
MRTVGNCGLTGSPTASLAGDDTDRPPPGMPGAASAPTCSALAIASALMFKNRWRRQQDALTHPLASSQCML